MIRIKKKLKITTKLIKENEKKFDYLFNKLNDKIIEHDKIYHRFQRDIEKIKEENENINKNIIDEKEKQKQENNELESSMKNIDYPNKINFLNYNNNNQNNKYLGNFILNQSSNAKCSNLVYGGISNNSPNKVYQNPNPEIIDKNDKKILYLNVVLKCLIQIFGHYFLKEQTINRIRNNNNINNNRFQLSNIFLTYAQNYRNKNPKKSPLY